MAARLDSSAAAKAAKCLLVRAVFRICYQYRPSHRCLYGSSSHNLILNCSPPRQTLLPIAGKGMQGGAVRSCGPDEYSAGGNPVTSNVTCKVRAG